MKLIILAAIAVTMVYSASETYTDKYDSLEIDTVLGNRRLFLAYAKCVLDVGKCTAEAKELKSHIAEALQNGCAKCTKSQRQGMKKVIRHMMKNEPLLWQQMIDKYDPKRIYVEKYENELKSL